MIHILFGLSGFVPPTSTLLYLLVMLAHLPQRNSHRQSDSFGITFGRARGGFVSDTKPDVRSSRTPDLLWEGSVAAPQVKELYVLSPTAYITYSRPKSKMIRRTLSMRMGSFEMMLKL